MVKGSSFIDMTYKNPGICFYDFYDNLLSNSDNKDSFFGDVLQAELRGEFFFIKSY
jgi:hypothetical protein